MIKVTIVLIFFLECGQNKINRPQVEGYYFYTVLHGGNFNKVDSLYLYMQKIRIEEFIYNSNFIQNFKIIDDKFIYKKLFQKSNVTGDLEYNFFAEANTIKLENKVLFSTKLLSSDTMINKSMKIKLVEKKKWIDIGGYWSVTHYGFDMSLKLVYIKKYLLDKAGSHSSIYLAQLSKFTFDKNISTKEANTWEEKNSDKMKQEFLAKYDSDIIVDYFPKKAFIVESKPIIKTPLIINKMKINSIKAGVELHINRKGEVINFVLIMLRSVKNNGDTIKYFRKNDTKSDELIDIESWLMGYVTKFKIIKDSTAEIFDDNILLNLINIK